MLEAEAALLLLLRRRTRPEGLSADAALWQLRALEHRLALDILAGRAAAARASLDALERELRHIPLARPTPDEEYEIWRAKRAARGWTSAYRHAAEVAADDGADDVLAAAARANQWRNELTAATEVADAFNRAREVALNDTAQRYPWLVLDLFKVWDATLDKQTCPVCGEAHGTIVRIDEAFPQGVPGSVHPRCRCQEHLLTRDELRMWGGSQTDSPQPQPPAAPPKKNPPAKPQASPAKPQPPKASTKPAAAAEPKAKKATVAKPPSRAQWGAAKIEIDGPLLEFRQAFKEAFGEEPSPATVRRLVGLDGVLERLGPGHRLDLRVGKLRLSNGTCFSAPSAH